MGDITGRPKAPPQQVVYVPQYIYANTPSTNTNTSSNDDNEDTPETEQERAKQREKNLLSRSRSRIGTVLTGFRGILSPLETDEKRKTLLGE